jgi:cytosine/uracil/thiamine/allantoin permease
MGLAFAFAGKRKWLLLFLIVGAIGQSSLLNTFCHIHTPLIISLLRGGIGWTLGAIIGIVLYALLTRREATEETIKSVEAQ